MKEKVFLNKEKIMNAGEKMCEVLNGLTLSEATVAVSHLLEAVIENNIEVSKDVVASFEISSSILVENFYELKKKYDLDFMAILSRNYLKRENPEMFKLIEEKLESLRDADDEDDDEEEGDDLVC